MAVYTKLSTAEIQNILAEYDIGELSRATEISDGIENSNYLIETISSDNTTHKHILTIYETRINNDNLPFFLGLMEHLAQNNISCPVPYITKSGDKNIRLENGKIAVIVTFIKGKSVDNININHISSLGETIGKMHAASDGFKLSRQNDLDLGNWRELLAKIGKKANEVQSGLYNILENELNWLESNWINDLPQGIIHADLFPDNVFFTGDKVSGVLDFYLACNDSLSYDLAIAINAWCFEADNTLNMQKTKALIASYSKTRPLEIQEKLAMPILCRGAALRFLLTRTYDWLEPTSDALLTKKNPLEYLEKLQFHQNNKLEI